MTTIPTKNYTQNMNFEQLCKFTSKPTGCKKVDCPFQHPDTIPDENSSTKMAMCKFMTKPGGCKKGDCPFQHPVTDYTSTKSGMSMCKFVTKPGGCRKADCTFQHPDNAVSKLGMLMCKFATKPGGCRKPDCTFQHPDNVRDGYGDRNSSMKGTMSKCKFVSKPGGCKKADCTFVHPCDSPSMSTLSNGNSKNGNLDEMTDYFESRLSKVIQGELLVTYSAYPYENDIITNNLDEIAVHGTVQFCDRHSTYESKSMIDPTWLEVAVLANDMLNKTHDSHYFFEGVTLQTNGMYYMQMGS
jgi:hypothetical protein